MKALLVIGMAAGALTLSSCSGLNAHCEGAQVYDNAPTLPTPESVDGLTVPNSPSALRIPPPPDHAVPFGQRIKDDKGRQRFECLDVPAPMAVEAISEKPPAEEKPKS